MATPRIEKVRCRPTTARIPLGPPARFLRRSSRSILIPPCRDQNPRLAPRLVEDADDLLQLVLRDPRVHRRRLNVRVAQVLLHHAQIAAGAPMQLYSTGMPECMRVKLWETRPPAEVLDDLPDPVVGHTTLQPVPVTNLIRAAEAGAADP